MPIIVAIVVAVVVLSAGGYFGYKYYNEKISNSLVPISSEDQNAQTVADETAGWKTYTNSQYGFEIKYPADNWRLFVEAPRGSSLHLMQIGAIDEFGSVQIYIQSGNVDSWLSNKAIHTRETVYINGLRAEKFYFGRDLKTDASFTYVFERNNLVYVINTSLIIGNKYGISETDISQILSTFKFTEKNTACAQIDSIDNSAKTKDIVLCYLNNEKSIFKSSLDVSKILSGTCAISELKDRYVDYKSGQVVNAPCSNCRLQGAEVWFRCDGYSSQFGCYFVINQDKSFGEIYCPSGV